MKRFVVISGCSGGGKSTLLAELCRRGHATVDEPGRRIVADELRSGGRALPWVDAVAFARRAIDVAVADHAHASSQSWTFFDRGLVDAACALRHLTGEPSLGRLVLESRYCEHVFLTPPWPAIYRRDLERRHGLHEAIAEYERLRVAYASIGHKLHVLPRTSVSDRANIVLGTLGID